MNDTEFEAVEIPSRYAKALVAILTGGLVAHAETVSDRLDGSWAGTVSVAIAVLTAILVYAVPQMSGKVANYSKGIIAFVGTGLTALLPYLIDGAVTQHQWTLVLISALGAIGVGIAPNAQAASYAEGDAVYDTSTLEQEPDDDAGKHALVD